MDISIEKYFEALKNIDIKSKVIKTKDRTLANNYVKSFVFKYNQYDVISTKQANEILGSVKFKKLTQDPIKSLGPSEGLFYYWNIVDCLIT